MFDNQRQNTERARYGRGGIRLAASLLKAFVTGDLGGIHAHVPGREATPDELNRPVYLDSLDYLPNQPDEHELIFGQMQLTLKLAREWGITPETLAGTLDRWLTVSPADPE